MKILEKVKADKTNKIAVTGLVLVSSYLSLIPNTVITKEPSKYVKLGIAGISAYVLWYLWMRKNTIAPSSVSTNTGETKVSEGKIISPAEKVGNKVLDPKQISRDYMALQTKISGETAKPDIRKASEKFFMSLSQNLLKDYKKSLDMMLRDERYVKDISEELKKKLLLEYELTEAKMFDMFMIYMMSIDEIIKGTWTGKPKDKINIDFGTLEPS